MKATKVRILVTVDPEVRAKLLDVDNASWLVNQLLREFFDMRLLQGKVDNGNRK